MDFQLAFNESAGYFDDIRESDWSLIKARIENTPNCASGCEPEEPAVWYQRNWEPAISCQNERGIGSWGDGGKWVCDPHRILKKPTKSCLVYSVGSCNDFSFEEGILKEVSPECEPTHSIQQWGTTVRTYQRMERSCFTPGVGRQRPWALQDVDHDSGRARPYRKRD